MNNRSYNQFCALAFALDVVGERWTFLIIRELLAGPRRFKDLIDGLPGISTNLLSDRLRSLEQRGLLARRVLPPPAGSAVYELTEFGRGLEPAIIELGRWGSQLLPPSLEGVAPPSLGTITVAMKAFFHPERAEGIDEAYELHLGHEVLHVRFSDGAIHVQQGQAQRPAAVFHTEMPVFVGLFAGQLQPAAAIAAGLVQVEGEPQALSRFLSFTSVAPAA